MRNAVLTAFLVYAIAQAYLGAQPLQRIEITLVDGQAVEGKLLAGPGTQDGTWYVATGGESMEAIPSHRVSALRMYRRAGDRGRFEGESVLDLIRQKR
jgi:hypothetical protein